MPESFSRRRVLAALAAGSTVAGAGCASVVDAVDSSGGDASNDTNGTAETTETTANRTTETTATETDTPRSESSPTESEWTTDDVSISTPAVSLSPAPLPDDKPDYPTMGEADETLTVYGSWKCPYTRAFVLDQLPGLVEEFVRSGEVSVRFRAVAYRGDEPFLGADAPRSTRAGLAVWETDPESFWTYFTYVFGNQPQERYRWGKPDLLERFAAAADVDDPEAVRQAAASEDAHADLIQQTVESAGERGVWTVPRVVYDGEVTAPTRNPSRTREQFRSAADR